MIEIKTKYTKESLENYYRFIGTRNTVRFVILFISLVAMLLGVSIGIGMADKTDDMNVPLEAVLFVFGLAIIIIFMFNYVWDYRLKPKMKTKAALKSNPQLLETEINLTFYEDHFLSVSSGGLISGTTETKYRAVLVVYEVKDFFYLHVKQNVPTELLFRDLLEPTRGEGIPLVMDKKEFTQGTPEEFTALMEKVLPNKKFKKCRGKKH
jgi:hypothetical protein